VRAELRGFYFNDAPELDSESFRPDDPENFGVSITAFVGPSDDRGEEMFDFVVCSARWLLENPPEKGFWFLRHHVLLTTWDYGVLERALRDLCAHAEGDTWNEVATKLSRYGRWEFEDYREQKPERLRKGGGGLR
jgi:Immunity protein 8